MVRNHYLLLGIPPDASQKQIKAAYRNLAKRFHPDRNKGSDTAAELFRQVNSAYRILSNPKLRTLYDEKVASRQSLERTDKTSATGPVFADNPQKFKKFIDSLLDALFGPLDNPAKCAHQQQKNSVSAGGQNSRKPDFNFYYHLAVEKKETSYRCGNDGVYRRASALKKKSNTN